MAAKELGRGTAKSKCRPLPPAIIRSTSMPSRSTSRAWKALPASSAAVKQAALDKQNVGVQASA
eukprot:6129685-Pyramimonas_sp.AAC.1